MFPGNNTKAGCESPNSTPEGWKALKPYSKPPKKLETGLRTIIPYTLLLEIGFSTLGLLLDSSVLMSSTDV